MGEGCRGFWICAQISDDLIHGLTPHRGPLGVLLFSADRKLESPKVPTLRVSPLAHPEAMTKRVDLGPSWRFRMSSP